LGGGYPQMQLFFNKTCLSSKRYILMLKLLFIAIACSMFGRLSAQNIDSRLLQRYSETDLAVLRNETPEKYNLLVYALDHALYTTALPSGKIEGLDTPRSLRYGETTNFLDLGLEILTRNQYIPLLGTDKMLVVKSEWVLLNEMKTKKL
jgi:hypothetical protein